MKKLKRVEYRVYDQLVLENMLNEESKKGWNLKKVGYLFYHFEKEDTRKYYYVDLNYADPEYMQNLEELGYQFVGNFQRIRIYCSDTQLEPLQTDPVVAGNILQEVNRTDKWYVMLLMPLLFWIISRFTIKFPWTKFNWMMHTESMIVKVLMNVMVVFWLMQAVELLVLRKLIRQKMDDEPQSIKLYRVVRGVSTAISASVIGLIIAYAVLSPTMLAGRRILIYSTLFVVVFIIGAIYNHNGLSDPKKWKRIVYYIAAVALMVAVQRICIRLVVNEQIQTLNEITAPYDDMAEIRNNSSRFVQTRAFGGDEISVVYIHTTGHHDLIIDGYKQRMVYWDTMYSNNPSSFNWSEVNGMLYEEEPVFTENTYDGSVFADNTDMGIEHVYTYKNYHILVNDDVIVIAVCHENKLPEIISHYYS